MHTHWVLRTRRFLSEVFGEDSDNYKWFVQLNWSHSGSRVLHLYNVNEQLEALHQEAYRNALETAQGILLDAAEQLELRGLDTVYRGKNTGPESSGILKILNLAESRLRKAVHRKPQNEREVQDIFETLLIGAEVEYKREKERIEYSSKTYTPDFSMPKLDLVTEIKFCTDVTHEKLLIPQINDDILAYGTKYGNQVFVVYDVFGIRDVEGFSRSFEKHPAVLVRVVKH